ncbi:MAG: AsmA-like C-terminal region-containing protein, partial [Rhodoferax sp.]
AGNDVQITPDSPKLTRARGRVNFTEAGVSLSGVQAQMLGGEVRLEGGLLLVPESPAWRGAPTLIRATGVASAEGLRQATELGFVARLARHATGTAVYTASLGLRKGVPELLVNSNLKGVALSLPEPLGKSADEVLPLRLQTVLLTDRAPLLQDRLSLSVANQLQLVYERDVSQAEPRVLRGALEVGLDAQESAPLPTAGVAANIRLKSLSVDAWQEVLTQATGAGAGATPAEVGPLASSYLPDQLAVRSDLLTFGGRHFNQVVIGGSREGGVWRANLAASELNGYLEYRPPNALQTGGAEGRVFARLARLTIAPSVASDVEALLEAQPASIPALDIVVDDFELRGKHLGRLEVQAVNRRTPSTAREAGVREWRLNQFNLSAPEASFVASGNWVALTAPAAAAGRSSGSRRTAMNFKLDVADSGALLSRFGMKDVVRGGRGKLEGQVAWMGSPLSLDYPSMSGAFTVNVESGQFLKADPGIAKLLGVLSLQALPRRLTLDFRDVFSEGFAFDFLRGDVKIDQGMAFTNNLQMKGVNAAVLMEGSADIARETQDIKAVVIPEINAGTAALLATVINPAVGLGTFLAQMFLRRPLIESATQEFHIDGSWADPQITKVSRTRAAVTEKKP